MILFLFGRCERNPWEVGVGPNIFLHSKFWLCITYARQYIRIRQSHCESQNDIAGPSWSVTLMLNYLSRCMLPISHTDMLLCIHLNRRITSDNYAKTYSLMKERSPLPTSSIPYQHNGLWEIDAWIVVCQAIYFFLYRWAIDVTGT
jgi:hypothetical protein